MTEAVVPQGVTYTFWGRGLSQGHSDAVRRVAGVAGGVQYTIPAEDVLDAVRAGEQPKLSAAQRHRRECYVVLEPGADPDVVSAEIKNMPHYFADYDTEVHFISAEELARDHATMPHGGTVLRSGVTGSVEGTHLENSQVVEYTLKLGHNPNSLPVFSLPMHAQSIGWPRPERRARRPSLMWRPGSYHPNHQQS